MAARIVQWVQKYSGQGQLSEGKGSQKAVAKTAKKSAKKAEKAEDGDDTKDSKKTGNSAEAGGERAKILVITGGFHTPGLLERLSGENWKGTEEAAEKLGSGKSVLGCPLYFCTHCTIRAAMCASLAKQPSSCIISGGVFSRASLQ